MAKPRCSRYTHVKNCRPGRPLCRWMRKVKPRQHVCWCSRYHFPHRSGSGRCGSDEKFWDYLYGPSWRENAERHAISTEGEGVPSEERAGDPDVPF